MFLLISRTSLPVREVLLMGLLLRVLALLAVPNLSDDFYRFYWDGLVSTGGVNPFAFLPSDILQSGTVPSLTEDLYQHLNSKDYHTIYPPFCQWIYMMSAWLSQGDLYKWTIIMRFWSMAAEVGTALLIVRLLRRAGMDQSRLIYYWLNPLVVLELSGNLHPEVFMICFALLAVDAIQRRRLVWGALFFSLAVSSKLIPLMLLPFFYKRLGGVQAIRFYALTGVFVLLEFLPLLSEAFLHGFTSSFLLYFQKFEFNASIYYIIRQVGYWLVGWNIIGMAGRWLAGSVFLLIMALAVLEDHRKHHVVGIFIWPMFVYFALATTVHPWYITPMVAFCVFSTYRFPVLWSFVIFLSYEGYSEGGYDETSVLVWLEYLSLYGMVAYELAVRKGLALVPLGRFVSRRRA